MSAKQDYVSALTCYAKSLEEFRQIGNQASIGRSLTAVGTALLNLGQLEQAAQCFKEALAVVQQASYSLVDGDAGG